MPENSVWELLLPPDQQGSAYRQIRHARGHRIAFADGDNVLDATSGLWNVNLGYGNEAIAEAVGQALRDSSYLTLFRYGNEYARTAADALIAVAGTPAYRRVLFSTSGSAANDAAMKIARQYAVATGAPQRRLVVGLHGSYHGQTFGGFALSGEDLGQVMYGVDTSLVRHVSHSDPTELAELLEQVGPQVAAVVVEPILGSGAHTISDPMLAAIMQLRHEHGFLLVADEVATGFGRTGTMFASERWPARPDLLLTSKGLTNGTCAAAAVLVSDAVYGAFEAANAMLVHAETQAGTPPSCAAIVATLDQFDKLGALENGRRVGGLLDQGLRELADRNELVAEVTGSGCFRALQLRAPRGGPFWSHHITGVIAAVRAHGALVHPGPSSILVVPPLTLSPSEVGELLQSIEAGLTDFAASRQRPRTGAVTG